MVGPQDSRHFFCPCPLSFLQPPLQTSEQDSIGRLDLTIPPRMLHRGKHLFDPELHAQLAQLLTRKLGTIIGHQVSWDPKTVDNVPPREVLDLVGDYMCNWFCFYPLGEVLNHHHEILHLTNCQRERTQDVYSPSMERAGAMY